MWKDLSPAWQQAFALAWESFLQGSIPIGALITDPQGRTVVTGRNQLGENTVPNFRTAHAETLCIRNLDVKKHPDFTKYHLYTTMEPCPMCMGTLVMGGIRNVHVAAKDRYCGALHYMEFDPYIQSKNLQVYMAPDEAASVQIVQQTCHEYRRYAGDDSAVLKKFREDYPREVALGKKLFEEGFLENFSLAGEEAGVVYDAVLQRLQQER